MALVIFLVEVFIALHVRDSFIRPHGGDLLAVALLYAIARGCFLRSKVWTAFFVLLFSFALEFVQASEFLNQLTIINNSWAGIVVGQRFDPVDLIMYTIGTMVSYNIDFWFCDNFSLAKSKN